MLYSFKKAKGVFRHSLQYRFIKTDFCIYVDILCLASYECFILSTASDIILALRIPISLSFVFYSLNIASMHEIPF